MAAETEDRFRTELRELAGSAPAFTPSEGTWSRARRARRRSLGLAVASVAVGIACLTSLVVVIGSGSPDAGPATPPRLEGVPAKIWAVPDRLVQSLANPPADERTWDPRVVEEDLAIGRGAVAFTATDGAARLPVVVTARDGAYHPLDLPGFSSAGLINAIHEAIVPLALSPDGTRLAYGWWDPTAPLDKPMPSGIRVVDLESGSVRTFPIAGGNGVRLESISWSPDSRWIAWTGGRSKSWTPLGSTFGPPIAGRISPAGEVGYLPGTLFDYVPVAITSTGLLAVQDGDATKVWDGGKVRTLSRAQESAVRYAAAWSPSGAALAITRVSPGAELEVVAATGERSSSGLVRPPFDQLDKVEPLGWLDDRTVLVRIDPAAQGEDTPDSRLALITPSPDGATTTVVGEVQPDVRGLTVAVDLVDDSNPTVQRPEPDWPWSQERVTWIVVLAALGVLGLIGALVLRRAQGGSGSARARQVGRWLGGTALVLITAYAVSTAVALADAGKIDYRLDRSNGSMTFTDDEPTGKPTRITGLPEVVRAGVDYPVRILVPVAEVGSHLEFSVREIGSGRVPSPNLDISLCPAGTTGVPSRERCRIGDGGRFAYAAPGVRELPAVVRFAEDQVGKELRLQYQVFGPRSAWNPFDNPSERFYVLGRVTPQA